MAKRGRRPSEPTADDRKKVLELLDVKTPLGDICTMLGRSRPWLRKYFQKELISEKNSALPDGVNVTPALRAKVARYIGCRMTVEQVAKAVGLTPDQLEAHFPDEIATGEAKVRAKVLDALYEKMEDGNVGATKTLEAITAVPEGSAPPAAGAGGKKAATAAAATQAAQSGGLFAPPPPPRLAVDNTKR